jgi:DNA polymerase sigma
MILSFLQTRKPPILPSLHSRPHKDYFANDGSESGFDDNLDSLRNWGSKNKLSLGSLLFQFFKHYGYDFKYDQSVVSIRQARILPRKEKGWQTGGKEGLWRLCIEEPFNSTRNLGNSADATAFRGIHLEIRTAFQHLCALDLNKMVETYEFPPEEKHIFKRPQASKVVLSSSSSQSSNRRNLGNGGSVRGSRGNGNRGNFSGPSSRRSSTGTGLHPRNGNIPPYMSAPIPHAEFMSMESMNFNPWQWQIFGKFTGHLTRFVC